MKTIMIMFDSLNRKWLPGYGGDATQYPNFARLCQRTAIFDNAYVCSMPCMPARRDFHTGRPNFLHSGWCPLQPYDESVPEMLHQAGTSSHLITDHYHYFEDGGCTYHNRYSTWQGYRGQEGDPWIGQVAEPEVPVNINGKGRRQDWVNRGFLKEERDFSQVQTFDAGIDFIERNRGEDNWFLQVEAFDPHEPFTTPHRFQAMHPKAGETPVYDWPTYDKVSHHGPEMDRLRDNYSALVSLCDEQLGRVLDTMDRNEMWDDTLLVVWTDHGFLLGEHQRTGKNFEIIWDEIGHTPFFVWDPRHPECAGTRRNALVQPAIDLGPTLLRFFGREPTVHMTGKDLAPVMAGDEAVRRAAIYGYFNRPLHITDGKNGMIRYVQHPEVVRHEYTMMPTRMRGFWNPDSMAGGELMDSLPFSNGRPVLRFPLQVPTDGDAGPTLLIGVEPEPRLADSNTDAVLEKRLLRLAAELCQESHAPDAVMRGFGLSAASVGDAQQTPG